MADIYNSFTYPINPVINAVFWKIEFNKRLIIVVILRMFYCSVSKL